MPRSCPLYYIAPSAISITPNANGSQRDLAVYVARGTKIKVYCTDASIYTTDGTYEEWTLSGRNRRLADTTGTVPYTIYARLSRVDKTTGYLVFAAKEYDESDGKWHDKYGKHPSSVAPMGCNTWVYNNEHADEWFIASFTNNVYVRLGEVSIADGNNQRTVTIDTGILGTDQYNSLWRLNPDDLPDKDVRYILEDRGQWTATPKVTYTGPTGQRTPDGTLDASVAAALGWTGEDALSFTQGQEIDEPYHYRSLTRQCWITQRLTADNSSLTDAELYAKLTGTTKGWEPENTLETSRVWKGGKLWECLVDGTTQEPRFGCTDWQVIAGDTTWEIKFSSTNGDKFYQGHVRTAVTARLIWGADDITDIVGPTAFAWTRSSENGKTDADSTWDSQAAHRGTNVLQLTDDDMPTAWSRNNKAVFTCTATVNDGVEDLEIENTINV